jgi:hypothetical protein
MSSVASPRLFHFLLPVVSLTVLGLASARANLTIDQEHENALLTVRHPVACPSHAVAAFPRIRVAAPHSWECGSSGGHATQFHSDLVGPDAVAFFFPPITVPPRSVGEPGIPVTPHVPPPPPPPHSPPPTDTAPEPATLISSALGASLLGLYSLGRRARKHWLSK